MQKSASQPLCNLCKSRKAKLLFRWNRYPDGWVGDIYKCEECRLVYREPIFDKSAERKVSGSLEFRPDSPSRFDKRQKAIYLNILKQMEQYRCLNRVLDVGSGYGHFVKLSIDNGWEGIGVEPRSELAEFSERNLGMPVRKVSFEKADLPEASFDVITLINVLEHLPDPLEALLKANRLLRSGGAVFIRTPNAAFHVPIRFIAYRTYHCSRKVREFDVSKISSYAFDKNTLSLYLSKANFTHPLVEGDAASFCSHKSGGVSGERAARKALAWLSAVVKFSTMGRCLVVSSLVAKASNEVGPFPANN